MATDKQFAYMRSLMAAKGVTEDELVTMLDVSGESLAGLGALTVGEAGRAIDLLNTQPDLPSVLGDAIPVAEVEAFLAGLGRKATMNDMTPELVSAATNWAKEWSGTFSFMVDMNRSANRGGLSVGQAKGVLNCWRADIGRRPKAASTDPAVGVLNLDSIPSGMYAVPGGSRLKVKINRPGSRSKWEGWTFVSDGAEYGRRTSYGRQPEGGSYEGKIVDELRLIAADPKAAAAEFGLLTGQCGLCGRNLEDEESVARGIGPVCLKKFQ